MSLTDERILVTGGASFIGSHLVEELVDREAKVRVADDFSSGTNNLAAVEDSIDLSRSEFIKPGEILSQRTAG